MDENYSFLDRIKQAEYEKLSDSQFVSSFEITSTANYVEAGISANIQSKEFKKSSLYKILFTCFAFGLLFLTIQQHMTTKLSIEKIIGGYFISALLLVLLFTQVYFGKKTIKRILIDSKGITINNQFFQWHRIAQTAILTEGGKYKSIYLILGFSDLSSYECYELNEFANANFGRFSRQLSTYIEYFKPKTMHNNHST